MAIMMVSLANLEEHFSLALASFSVIAATVWATVRTTGLLEKSLWEV
jgi:hypothetical protein